MTKMVTERSVKNKQQFCTNAQQNILYSDSNEHGAAGEACD